jgi:hypothetical protein
LEIRVYNGQRIAVRVVAGQLIIPVIVGMRSITTAIMHGKELKEINAQVLAMMLKKMIDKVGQFYQLTHLGMCKQVHNDQRYD